MAKLPKIGGGLGSVAGHALGGAISGSARVISGSIQGAATVASGALQAMGSTLGGALEGLLTPPDINVVNNINTGGDDKKSSSNTTAQATKVNKPTPVNASNMTIKELLGISIGYLESIQNTLHTKHKLDAQNERVQNSNDREDSIESPLGLGDKFKKGFNGLKDKAKDSSKNGLKSLLSGALKIGGLVGAMALMTSSSEEIEKFADNVEEFMRKYDWLFGAAFGVSLLMKIGRLKSVGALITWVAPLAVRLISNPWALAGMAAVGVVSSVINSVTGGAHDEATASLDKLETEWGMKRITGPGGTTVAYEINGQRYDSGKLPEDYKRILDAYGPLARGPNKDSKYIDEHPEIYDQLRKDIESATTPPKSVISNSAYNTSFGDVGNKFQNNNLTNMTIGEVMKYQETLHKKHGHTPVGAYQINKATLGEYAEKTFGEGWQNQKFSGANQDAIASKIWDNGNRASRWATMRDRNYKGVAFEDAKGTIVQRETKRLNASDDIGSSLGGAASTIQNSISNVITGAVDVLRSMGKHDSTYVAQKEAVNYDKYIDLYNKSIEVENKTDLIKSVQRATAERILNSPTGMLRGLNGGGLDVINPNYKLGEVSILSTYLKFFNVGTA